MGTQRVIVAMPDELVAAIDRYAAAEERSRSSVIRRTLQSVMQPEKFRPVIAVAPAGHAVEWVKATGPDPSGHEFRAQAGNALRCADCGLRKGDHK